MIKSQQRRDTVMMLVRAFKRDKQHNFEHAYNTWCNEIRKRVKKSEK